MFKDKYNRPDRPHNPRQSVVNVTSDYRYDGTPQETFISLGTPGTSMQKSELENHIAILEDFASRGKTHICIQETDVDVLIRDEINRLRRENDQVDEVFYEVLRRIKKSIV
jgi:hypothetical protein